MTERNSNQQPEEMNFPVEPGSKEAYKLVGEIFKKRRITLGLSQSEMVNMLREDEPNSDWDLERIIKLEAGNFKLEDPEEKS